MSDEFMSRHFLLVAAIDFGTTFSGYAFSTRHQYATERERISAFQWSSSVGKLISPKTPSCVLFKPDKTFDSCGFQAEQKYSELALDSSQHKDWYFFRRMKMALYKKKHFERNFILRDESRNTNKDPMAAIDVFAAVIRYFKDQLLAECCRKLPELNITEDDIRWVVTVPAIWNDAAKQFMREAAEMAGLPKSNLMLALEPEASSLFCKLLPTITLVERKDLFKKDNKYIVVDAGGGTVDVTVHKVLSSGDLEEVHKATGGDWGGTKVDEKFVELLTNIFGEDVYKTFVEYHKYDELDIMEDFEVKKRSLTLESESVTLKIPNSLIQIYKRMHSDFDLEYKISKLPKYHSRVKLVSDKLKIDSEVIRDLFATSTNEIVKHIRTLTAKSAVKDAKNLLMVGGFSESKILQDAIRTNFPFLNLVLPPEPSLAVVKGAVLYGHDPLILESRICKLTYGIATNMPFEEGIDSNENCVMGEHGELLCTNRFSIHVKIGEQLDTHTYQTTHTYKVLKKDQKDIHFQVFTSTNENPRYVTDAGCELLGMLTLKMPNITGGIDRCATVKMKFGGTELVVTAKDPSTKKKVDAKLKLLD